MVATPNIAELRAEFARCRENAAYTFDKDEWMAEVRLLAESMGMGFPTPEHWVEAARRVALPCPTCNATGMYSWGTVTNGRPAKSGPCFRCGGRGEQTQADCARNRAYDNYHRRVI